MADINLKFFNKQGNPLNFEYIGPTGDTPLNFKFQYRSSGTSSSKGELDVSDLNSLSTVTLNIQDNNGFYITGWANELASFLQKGAKVDIYFDILPENKFKGRVSSVTVGSSTVSIYFSSVTGQTLISSGKRIRISTQYSDRPGGYFSGNVFFDTVSAGLYENSQIFIVQEAYSLNDENPLWSLESSGTSSQTINRVSYVSQDTFAIVGGNGTSAFLNVSVDGGQSFSNVSLPSGTTIANGLSWNGLTGSSCVYLIGTLHNAPSSTGRQVILATGSVTSPSTSYATFPKITGQKSDVRGIAFTETGGQTAVAVGRSYTNTQSTGSLPTLNGRIWRSIDSGSNWVDVTPSILASSQTEQLWDVQFIGGTGFAIGENSQIFYSNNSGLTWSNVATPTIGDFIGSSLLDNGYGWAVGNSGVAIATYNYGQSWIGLDTGFSVDLYAVHFWDNLNGYAVGSNGLIIRTYNGGFSWKQVDSPTSSDLNCVYASTPDGVYGFAGGDNNDVLLGDLSEKLQYIYPRAGSTGGSGYPLWRTRWESDNYGDIDVSEIIFTYKIEEGVAGSNGDPLIVSYPNIAIPVDYNSGDYYSGGYLFSGSTGPARSETLNVNVAINASDLYADVYERKLIIEDLSSGSPEKIAEINFYGEVIGEDERFKVMVQNLGRTFTAEDANILRYSDPEEPVPNFLEINEKRKELLLAGDEIYNYIGAYKGLINAIKFFGYQDLRIKEYWLNLSYTSLSDVSPLLQNQSKIDQLQSPSRLFNPSGAINDVLNNANKGKYRLVQTYGPDGSGNYKLDLSGGSSLVPSKTLKKTSLFGLYYDLNKVTTGVDDFGYPVVEDSFAFTQEEVLIKLFALKERLKKTYLPLNARIIDITGEGIYFMVYNTRSWTDSMIRSDIDSGFYLDISANPSSGYLEDLRALSLRVNASGIQVPLNYFDAYSSDVSLFGTVGASGGAIYFDNLGVTGPNPVLTVTAGKTYTFNLIEETGSIEIGGFDFYLSNNPPTSSQADPVGVTGNGTTGNTPVVWTISPEQTSPVYYYSSFNSNYCKGEIIVLPVEPSDFGNTSDPLSALQVRGSGDNQSMISAISEFYALKQNDGIINLGDSIQDPTDIIDPTTGVIYKNPLGMPVVLELLPDIWLWEEMSMNWSSLSLPLFRVNDFVLVRQYQDVSTSGLTGGWYGTITAANFSTGEYTLQPSSGGSTVTLGGELLISPSQEYLLSTWQNIDFSNMIEIEWIISKSPTQTGIPYYFEFRGSVLFYHRLAHFLPYVGDYKVICNVYDAFNAKTTVIENNLITVKPKTIEIDAWSRYRQVEIYDWEQIYRQWDDYQSMWEFPAEGESYSELTQKMSPPMLNYSTYGNNLEEGQSMYVGGYSESIGATGYFKLAQSLLTISSVISPEVTSGTFGFAGVTTSTPHGLSEGETVYISGSSLDSLNGSWQVDQILDSTSFTIPITLLTSMSNVTYNGSGNQLAINGNEKVTASGTLKVYSNGILIGQSIAGDSLYKTTNSIVASVNLTKTYPDYYASCPFPEITPTWIEIQAPSETGSSFNGYALTFEVSGSLSISEDSGTLSGGTGSYFNYTYWNETSTDFPNANLVYWGSKRINWDVFQESQWEDGYAHSWEDYSFNEDWLGGFEIHSASDGDHLLLSTGSPDYPFPIGVTFSASSPGQLTFGELLSQLSSSSDHYINNFTYSIFPSNVDENTISTTSNLYNTDSLDFPVSDSAASASPWRS